jgi:hypothetical protein
VRISTVHDDNVRLLDDVNREGGWFHAKKTRPVWVRVLTARESVRTLEGIEVVDAGNVVCRGEAGDLWPQSPESLRRRYAATDEVDASGWRKYVPLRHAEGVMAVRMPAGFVVHSRWGTLTGKPGDYLVKNFADRDRAYPDDLWVVDQSRFSQTYEAVSPTGAG